MSGDILEIDRDESRNRPRSAQQGLQENAQFFGAGNCFSNWSEGWRVFAYPETPPGLP
jgi:hypothetical protein